MHAHRLHVTIPDHREITVRVPGELPAGPAEIIILSQGHRAPRQAVRMAGVLASDRVPDGDPIAEALQELRNERQEAAERGAAELDGDS